MDANLTDEQQVEALKKLWKEYGFALTAGVIIAIVIATGWRFYQQHITKRAQEASLIYERMMGDFMRNDIENVKKQSEILIDQFKRTPYATFATFALVKIAVEQKAYDQAIKLLDGVIQHCHNKDFCQIARIRAARLYLMQDQTEKALKILEPVENPSFNGLISEVKGDIYIKQGQKEKAKKAYQAALDQLPPQAAIRPLLQMKLDNL